MYLDAVERTMETSAARVTPLAVGREPYAPWVDWPATTISHHGTMCCEIVREWLANTDQSALNAGSIYSGPRWLRQSFDWGPTVYPVYWCEVLKQSQLDCGVHAALAYEVFVQRGVRAYRAQIVQEFTADAAASWHAAWSRESAVTAWLDEDRIYHEGVAIRNPSGRLKLWDPSAGWWIDAKPATGYGSVLAIRITAPDGETFDWGGQTVTANEWTTL